MTAAGVDLAAVLAAARARAPDGRPALVGVDGPSGSGKSTLARALAALGAAPLVEVDDFWTWDDDPRWWEHLVDGVLLPLAAGQDARYRPRDWAAGALAAQQAHVRAAPVVVVEGVTATRRAVHHLYAYRILVDAPEAVRLGRGLERDGEHHRETWLRWLALEAQHFAQDGTAARADLRVQGA